MTVGIEWLVRSNNFSHASRYIDTQRKHQNKGKKNQSICKLRSFSSKKILGNFLLHFPYIREEDWILLCHTLVFASGSSLFFYWVAQIIFKWFKILNYFIVDSSLDFFNFVLLCCWLHLYRTNLTNLLIYQVRYIYVLLDCLYLL